jgi:phosphatidylglycerophosphate synthase
MTIKLKDIPIYSENVPFKERLMANCAKPLTWLLLHTNITANQVTTLSMVLALIGSALMIPGIFLLSLIGLFLFCMFMLLDHTDGQVARYRNQVSSAGLYLDSRVHHLVEPTFFICTGIGAFISSGNVLYLFAGICTSTFYLMRQLMKPDNQDIKNFRTLGKEKTLFGKVNYFLFQFLRINYPFSLLFFAIIFDVSGVVLEIYALIFLANLIMSFYKTYKSLANTNG